MVAELVQVLMVDVPHEQLNGKDGKDGKERWIKEEIERRATLKLQKEKQDKERHEKKSYAQALESPENKLPSSQEGLTFDASSPDQPSNATLDINTPNGSSPTFLPSPDGDNNEEELLGNEEVDKDEEEEELSPLGMLFILCCMCLIWIGKTLFNPSIIFDCPFNLLLPPCLMKLNRRV